MDAVGPTKGSSHSHAFLSLCSKAADYRRIPNGATNSGSSLDFKVLEPYVGSGHLKVLKCNLEHAEWRLTRVARAQQQSRDTPAHCLMGCEVVRKQCEVLGVEVVRRQASIYLVAGGFLLPS